MPLPKAILFDADGTLYDSEPINFEANRLTAKQLHDYDLKLEDFDHQVRRGAKRTYMLLEEAGHAVDREHYLAIRRGHYERLVVDELITQPGLIPFLEWCRTEGIVCGVVSAMQRVQLLFALKTLLLDGYFEFVIGLEDVGEQSKPDAYPYLLGLQKAGITAAEAVAVEDTEKGMTSALNAGLRVIAIRNSTNGTDDLSVAESIIDEYGQLRSYLESV